MTVLFPAREHLKQNPKQHRQPYPQHQRGMATLMFSVVLLVALTIITFTSARTLLAERAISSNEYRGKEAAYAAEAALEYGLAWLADSAPEFADWDADNLAAPDISLSSSTDNYTLSASFSRHCLDGGSGASCSRWTIRVTAVAVADADSDLERQQVLQVLQTKADGDNPDYIRIPGSWRDWEIE